MERVFIVIYMVNMQYFIITLLFGCERKHTYHRGGYSEMMCNNYNHPTVSKSKCHFRNTFLSYRPFFRLGKAQGGETGSLADCHDLLAHLTKAGPLLSATPVLYLL